MLNIYHLANDTEHRKQIWCELTLRTVDCHMQWDLPDGWATAPENGAFLKLIVVGEWWLLQAVASE